MDRTGRRRRNGVRPSWRFAASHGTVPSVVPRNSDMVKAQPWAKPACGRPGVDEAIDVRVAALPSERGRCVRPRNGSSGWEG